MTGNGVGAGFEVGSELKEKLVLVGVGIAGVLRSMVLRLDVVTVDGMTRTGPWALTPTKEGGELTAGREDGGTLDETTEDVVTENGGGKPGASPELGTAGEDEHEGPVTVTVTAESIKTVSIRSAPVVVKVGGSPCTAGFVVADNGGVVVLPKLTPDGVVVESKGENKAGVLEGTIPPRLNELVEVGLS